MDVSSETADVAIVEDAPERSRDRRRSSITSLSLPVCDQGDLASSMFFSNDEVEFEAQGVKINHDGLFIEGLNVSEVHQDDLRVLGELGRGACSVVKKAQHVETRQVYAIKVFSVFDREKRGQLLKEVETLRGMECPSLINFAGGYLKDGSIHMVLEYMDRGSLTDLIHEWKEVEYGENLMAAVTIQILWGLGYLHFEHRVHRDIKPGNVLLNSKGEVKLSDFGIARALEGDTDLAQTMVGTIRYMSPERLAGAGYGVAADVWSVGVVIMEMASRTRPFDSMVSQIEFHDNLEQDRALDDLMKLAPDRSPQLDEVIRGCLQMNPDDRLAPEELLALEWFRPFREPSQEIAGDAAEACGGRGACQPDARCGGCSTGPGDGGQEQDSSTPSNGDCGDAATAGEGGEQHDLDRATSVVRDYIERAVDEGMVTAETESAVAEVCATLAERGYDDLSGSGMIHTMHSDVNSDSENDDGGDGGGEEDIF